MYKRANAKWTVNECLRLEREFDLLELSVQEIALLHERSPHAIMYKLDAEGMADFNEVFLNRQQKLKVSTSYDNDANEESESDEDKEDDSSNYEASEEEDEEEDNVNEDNEEFDIYNIKQQMLILTKQLANLTAIVYKVLSPNNSSKTEFASCR